MKVGNLVTNLKESFENIICSVNIVIKCYYYDIYEVCLAVQTLLWLASYYSVIVWSFIVEIRIRYSHLLCLCMRVIVCITITVINSK